LHCRISFDGQVGIFDLLDDACNGNKTDDEFSARLVSIHKDHPRFVAARFARDNEFTVRHFVRDVTYKVVNFLSKNSDFLHDDLEGALGTSVSAFVRSVHASATAQSALANSGASSQKKTRSMRRRSSILNQVTVGSQFREQLRNLMGILETTQVLIVFIKLVLTVFLFSIKLVLTVLLIPIKLALTVLIVLTKLVLTVLLIPTKLALSVLPVLIFLTELVRSSCAGISDRTRSYCTDIFLLDWFLLH
jgi:hypothetical protein